MNVMISTITTMTTNTVRTNIMMDRPMAIIIENITTNIMNETMVKIVKTPINTINISKMK